MTNVDHWLSPRSVPRPFLLRWTFWYFQGVGVLLALLALRYLPVAPVHASFLAITFTVMMFVAQGALLGLLMSTLVMLSALILPRPRWIVCFAILVSVCGLTIVLIDTFVYQQYRFHIDAGVWNLIAGGAAEETFVFAPVTFVKLGAVVLGLAVVLALLARLVWSAARRGFGARRSWIVVAALFIVVVTQYGMYIWADAAGFVPITQQARVLPLYQRFTAKRGMRKLGIEVVKVERIPGEVVSGLAYPRAPLTFHEPATRPNVMFIVIDSWRADALDERTTPNLAAFAATALRFPQHYSGGNATRIGIFSLFYGIPGTYWHEMLAERRGCVLVQEFIRQGYELTVFRAAPLFSPEFDSTIFSGVSGLRLKSDGNDPAERDHDLTEDYLAWIAARDTTHPFFTLLFYDAPHAYNFPPDWKLEFEPSLAAVDYMALDQKTDPTPLHNRYRNSVRYDDHLVGRVLDDLRARGLMDETIVLVTGDHGQEFNDLKLNYWGHNSNFAAPQTHVPMIVHWPGRAPHTFAHTTSHMDVAPTFMTEVLRCTSPADDYSVGKDLFDTSDRGPLSMAGYNVQAGVLPGERYVVAWQSGDLDVLDANYRPRPITDADREVLKVMLRQRGWFRPRHSN